MRKALVLLATLVLSAAFAQNSVEIFSWWAGDEGPALEALIKQHETDHPGVEVINATVTGGSGVNARAVLKTRMLGGDPPDSFQVHAGQELIGTWVVADRMEDLTSLFKEQGWLTAFPQGLLDLISTDKGIWSVPVNIHRSNVLWYVPANLEKWGVTVPADWNEFVTTTCPALRTAGVTPLVIGENWTVQHLWESVAVAEMGPDGWRGLWDGSVAFDSPEAQAVWETFDKVLACTNADFTGLSWQQATDRVANGQAAFNVMGDWAAGYMATTLGLEPGTGFAWAASPGTDGVFILLADSFGLPKGAPDRDNALAWLELVGSKKGQDIFNPLKGSISPRLDSDLSKYNAYGKSAAADYQSDTQVGSLVHGAVANETFMSDFATVMETFLSNRDAAEAASLAAELAGRAHIGN